MRSYTAMLALVVCATCAMAEDNLSIKAVSESTDLFAAKFFKTVASEKKGENLISSPLSAHVVLSMTAYGAGGNTAKQMRESLSLPADDSVARQGFQNLIDELNNVKNVTLDVANKIFLANDLNLKSEFKELTSGPFRSEAGALDIKQPSESAKSINNWVDEKTHSKIKEIIKADEITPDTRMVLLNAIYFKGKWANAFKKINTNDRPFYYMENQEKKEKNVPTMYANANFFYGELPDLKAKFVELPYENKDLKMVIIVPNEIDGLSDIEKNLEAFDYKRLAQAGSKQEIHLYLPKFKIESTIDLGNVLMKLGMTDMFSNVANFTGISNEALKVDKVVQKAFIEVNEEGSEAAAVTEVGLVLFSSPQIYYLNVDRPFYYEIVKQENEEETVTLFSGVVKTL